MLPSARRRASLLSQRLRRDKAITLNQAARALVRAVLVVLVLLLCGELAVRKFVDDAPQGGGGFHEYRPHPTLFWQLRPNMDGDVMAEGVPFHVRSNSLGLRNDEIPQDKAANCTRILCLGDSITFGYGVRQEQTYETRLQAMLRARYPGHEFDVINGGCPGYSSFQGLQVLKLIGLRYAPDVLIVSFIYADPATEADSDRTRAGASPLLQKVQIMLYESRLYLYLRRAHLAARMPTGPREVNRERTPRVSADEFAANLREFADVMRARGGHVVYVNLAKKPDMPNAEHWLDPHQQRYDRYRAIIRQVARDTGNEYVDCDAPFAADARYFLDPIHPNAEGFALMARLLADRLIGSGWLQ